MSQKLFDELLISSPESLGDILVANGLYHYFIEKSRKTTIGVSDTYFETTKSLYQDFSNVEIVKIKELEELKNTKAFLLPLPKLSATPIQYGDGSHGSVFICWDQQYYNSFDLPYSLRYRNFKMPKHIEGSIELKEKLTEGEKDYIVVNRFMGLENTFVNYFFDHYNPNKYKVVEIHPQTASNALQYVELFKHAKQIHVLPTSFHHLVESMLDDITGELYFHHARRNFYCTINNTWNDHRWKIINYEHKL